MQKRANSLARDAATSLLAVLILPILAAGLLVGVGSAGGEDRGAVASADQVAPGGCTVRLRSPNS
jgi:hypothetical protein